MRLFRSLALLALFSSLVAVHAQSAAARSVVPADGIGKGTIVIKTSERRLYVGIGQGKALQYPVGVGRSGKQWTGQRRIRSKHIKPAWQPTAEIKRDKPSIADVIPGGSPRNPMGAAALVLSGDGQYAIHGTNNPRSIGGFVSYGCIRMHNDDILDLYERVRVGTPVIVTQ